MNVNTCAPRTLLVFLLPLIAAAASTTATAALVFMEDFSTYTSTTAATDFYKKWTRLSGSGNLSNAAFNASDSKFTGAWLQVERNTVHQYTLAPADTITGDFSLSATVSFDATGASGKQLWFGLFDAAGTHGYVAHFNSQTSGGGVLRLKEFNVAATSDLTYNLGGTNLTTSAVSSGLTNAITGSATLTLKWNATTQKLSLLINDTPVTGLTDISVSATAITSFSNITFGGVTGAQFSNIQLSGTTTVPVPEPATFAIVLAAFAFLVGLAIHRRRSQTCFR
ncbi:PEP-CTERM domain protein [Geminisphaera colitermitum]|uniref:PEP-CTERM domain protein n=1 Tax=Geminisphaera colitermitum TaxID=1148786 RepID=UPI000158D2D3|nr:PEP-CTERM domain protein [Geminisphaera colitermitum]